MKVRTIVKSELGPYDPAYNNIRNALETAGIFDVDWFAETGNEDKEHYYDEFIEEFADWLETQDELVTKLNEYRNQPFDVEYYFVQYMQDDDAIHDGIAGCYNAVFDWVQGEEDFAASEEYLDEQYRYDAGATDIEFYANQYDIEENAKRIFKEQNYTQEDITHGFSSAADMAEAVMKAVDDGHLEDVDQYDAGGMGYHAPVDGTEDYFETGSCFLGNGEIEWQMQTSIPYSEKNDYADELIDCRSVYRYFAVRGDCIYTTSDRMYIYGVPWADVEEAGRELGLLNGEAVNKDEPPVYNADDESIPMF